MQRASGYVSLSLGSITTYYFCWYINRYEYGCLYHHPWLSLIPATSTASRNANTRVLMPPAHSHPTLPYTIHGAYANPYFLHPFHSTEMIFQVIVKVNKCLDVSIHGRDLVYIYIWWEGKMVWESSCNMFGREIMRLWCWEKERKAGKFRRHILEDEGTCSLLFIAVCQLHLQQWFSNLSYTWVPGGPQISGPSSPEFLTQ